MAFVLLAVIGGSGFLAYAILWALVPARLPAHRHDRTDAPATVDGRSSESSLLLVLGATGVVLGALLLVSHGGDRRAWRAATGASLGSARRSSGCAPTRDSVTGCAPASDA